MQTAAQTVYYGKGSALKTLTDLQNRMQPLLDQALHQYARPSLTGRIRPASAHRRWSGTPALTAE
jgi:hypothetical protein